jgi:hypothetical protein
MPPHLAQAFVFNLLVTSLAHLLYFQGNWIATIKRNIFFHWISSEERRQATAGERDGLDEGGDISALLPRRHMLIWRL